jgi:hypothetical protein
MIPALIGLRAAIDQAITVLGPLEPVPEAWQAPRRAPPRSPRRHRNGLPPRRGGLLLLHARRAPSTSASIPRRPNACCVLS